MDKMNVITFSETGNVLGVVTRASQPETPATVEQVANGGFRLRSSDGNNTIVQIPEDEISVSLMDYDTRVLYQPHLFVLEDGQLEEKTPVSPDVDLDGNVITVTLPGGSSVTSHITVWCHVSGGSLLEPRSISIEIEGEPDSPAGTGTEAMGLGIGDYQVAVFTPSYSSALYVVSIT